MHMNRKILFGATAAMISLPVFATPQTLIAAEGADGNDGALEVVTQAESDDATCQASEAGDGTDADASAVEGTTLEAADAGAPETDGATATSPDADGTAPEVTTTSNDTPSTAQPEATTAETSDFAGSNLEAAAVTETANETPSTATAQSALSEGLYEISLYLDSSKRIDVSGASTEDGAAVQVWSANGTAAQRWQLRATSDGYYTLQSDTSGKFLDVPAANAYDGNGLQQYTGNMTYAQQWIIEEDAARSGAYVLRSRIDSNYVMDVSGASTADGTRINLWEANGTDAQSFFFSRVADLIGDGVYEITNEGSGKALDVSGGSIYSESNVHIWETNGTNAQRYLVSYDGGTGYYAITNATTGLALDVAGASTADGANVQAYTANGTLAQRWSIISNGAGYRIVSAASGLSLDVAAGSTDNGANAQQFTANDTAAQRWNFKATSTLAEGTYYIHSVADKNYVADIDAASTAEFANAQLFSSNGTAAQLFEIVSAGNGYYTIRNVNSGKYLSVAEVSSSPGTNVCQEGFSWTSNGSAWTVASGLDDHKLWMATPTITGIRLTSKMGLTLDVNDAIYANYTNLKGWEDNGGNAQRWALRPVSSASLGITDFFSSVSNDKGSASCTATKVGGTTYLFLPSNANLSKVSLGFNVSDNSKRASVSSSSNGSYTTVSSLGTVDLTTYPKASDGTYTVYVKAPNGTVSTLKVMKSANVSAMYLTSDDPWSSGRSYVEASGDHTAKTTGTMQLVGTSGSVTYNGGLTQIKGRGNSTWGLSKKPYQIKLETKTSLIDGSKGNKSKTWVLLANAFDPTRLKDYVVSQLGLEVGLEETPDSTYVDLFYDGEYRGSYLLSEKVQVGSGRVDIDEIDNGDVENNATATATNAYGYEFQYVTGIAGDTGSATDAATGGYLIELDDYYQTERSWFATSIGNFVIKSPEDASQSQVRYISELVQAAINEASKVNGNISSVFDVASLSKTFLLNQVSKNPDYIVHSSTYFYKKAGDTKLYAGPLWDFDQAFGVQNNDIDYTSYEGLANESSAFFLNNETFKSQVKSDYNTYVKGTVSDMLNNKGEIALGTLISSLTQSVAMDDTLWGNYRNMWNEWWHTANSSTGVYATDASYFKSWLTKRLAWLSSYFG